MRRTDREVKNIGDIMNIMDKCEVCRIAMIDEGVPYILPMNFGYKQVVNNLELYFHCAGSGRKISVLEGNPVVGFEIDCSHRLIKGEFACQYSFEYESVIGTGIVAFLETVEDKRAAMMNIMSKLTKKENFEFLEEQLKTVKVFKIRVEEISGKRHKR